jgi:hypothetical protein
MQNGRVNTAGAALYSMRSIEPGPNPRVSINQLIPNFPPTPDTISQMTGILPVQCFLFFSRLAELINVLRSGTMP